MTQRDRFEAVYDAHYPAIHQYAARRTRSPTVPDSWLVSDVALLSSTAAGVWATPEAREPNPDYTAALAGCPKG